MSVPSKGAGAEPSKRAKPGKSPGPTPAAVQAAPKKVLPEYADVYPSEHREPAPDLQLDREQERKAKGLSEFALALVAEDNAEAERALAGYRKTLEADPGYTELAIKVALDLARRNEVSAGIQILKDAIKAKPREPLPLVFLSQLYSHHLKKPDLALRYAEQALTVAPDNPACYSALFELHMAGGQTKKAEQLLERALQLGSTDPKLLIQLGDMFAQLYLKEDGTCSPQELERMNAIYRKAAGFGASDPTLLSKVGDYFILSRQTKEAIPFYLKALKLAPGPTDPPTNNLREKLARAFLVSERPDEAITLLESIIKENPTRYETYELLGELYRQKGQLDKALANYEHSLLLDDSEPRNYLRLSEILLQAKRHERAVQTMRKARAKFPDNAEVTYSLGLTLSQAKQHKEAMAIFDEALAQAQKSQEDLLTASFYFQYGAAAEQAGQLERAAELLKRSIELDPANSAQAHNYLGYMWADRGENLEEALKFIQKALSSDPENGAYLDSLGWCYFKQGQFEAALKELLRAEKLTTPEDPVIYDHLAETYLALGKKAEAITYWQKSLALDPDNKATAAKLQALKPGKSD